MLALIFKNDESLREDIVRYLCEIHLGSIITSMKVSVHVYAVYEFETIGSLQFLKY